jgi:hypothetical protein
MTACAGRCGPVRSTGLSCAAGAGIPSACAVVLLAVAVALALQAIRQSLGFGLPQLPA